MSDPNPTGLPPNPTYPPYQPPAPPAPNAEEERRRLESLNTWAQSFAAREKAEGRQTVEKDIVEKLGMTLDEAQAFMKQVRDAEAANLTEAQRLHAEALEAQTRGTTAEAGAHRIILDSLCQDALMHLGMTRDQAKHAQGMLNVGDVVTVDTVVAAAAALKVGFPQLFPADAPGTPVANGNGTPGTERPQGGPVDSATRGTPVPTAGGGTTARDRALARLRNEQPGGRLRSDPPPPEYDYRRST